MVRPRNIPAVFIALLGAALTLAGCDKHAGEKVEIQAAWDGWDQATARQDGEAAVRFLTKPSIEAYDRLVKLALNAKPDEIKDLTPSEQLSILDIRTRAKRSEIKMLDGRGYYVLVVDRAWHTEPAGLMKLRNITVMGERATAVVYDVDEPQPNPLLETRRQRRERKRLEAMTPQLIAKFTKEGGEWKFDDRSFASVADLTLTNAAKAENTTVRAIIEAAYEEEHQEPPPEDVWKPMK